MRGIKKKIISTYINTPPCVITNDLEKSMKLLMYRMKDLKGKIVF